MSILTANIEEIDEINIPIYTLEELNKRFRVLQEVCEQSYYEKIITADLVRLEVVLHRLLKQYNNTVDPIIFIRFCIFTLGYSNIDIKDLFMALGDQLSDEEISHYLKLLGIDIETIKDDGQYNKIGGINGISDIDISRSGALKDRLEKLQEVLGGLDPIKYLKYLRYGENRSYNEIASMCERLGLNWPVATLEKNMKSWNWLSVKELSNRTTGRAQGVITLGENYGIISSWSSFLTIYNERTRYGQLTSSTNNELAFLNQISTTLEMLKSILGGNVDPIEYILFLYSQGFEDRDISKKLGSLGVNISEHYACKLISFLGVDIKKIKRKVYQMGGINSETELYREVGIQTCTKIGAFCNTVHRKFGDHVDPVAYIAFQYYVKELPISEVTTVIKRQLDLDNITSGDLSTWMRKKFRWILRNPLEIAHTSHTAKRLKAKKSPANKIKAKEKEERIAECIQTIKGGKKNTDIIFNLSTYTSLTNAIQKVKYLLCIYGYFSFTQFNEKIKRLSDENKYGIKSTAIAIERLINEIIDTEKIQISPFKFNQARVLEIRNGTYKDIKPA